MRTGTLHVSCVVFSARGPDCFNEHHVSASGPSSFKGWQLTFASTVLALRGDHVQAQPLVDDATESVFCWNGEAWKVNHSVIEGNDSLHVFRLLLEASRSNSRESIGAILTVLNNVSGPFAFVYYDKKHQKLLYGRDRLGRRSLLACKDEVGGLKLSSVCGSKYSEWYEVGYEGVQVFDLTTDHTTLCPWTEPILSINNLISLNPTPYLDIESPSVAALQRQLVSSLRLRVADIPLLGTSTADDAPSRAPKVAILFSGGLDCTILARLAHEILDPKESIDLLNVAFENPRSVAAARLRPNFDPYEACPDRITGRRSFVELFKACPGREFRFVAIDIPFSETQAHRSTVISLMYPQNTEMDLSISMALYFAARGKGTATISPNVSLQENSATAAIPPYTTSARVLLSGLGADELFAGYTRHATAFSRQGYPGLIAELALDITRLGTRNLGRDDRIISHCSKEVRYPYLDEDFVKWALQAPVWEKCGFGEHRPQPSDSTSIVSESNVTLHQHRRNVTGEDKDINGIEPAKKVLRLLAQTLDLPGVAREKKRAIQFGAKTAKMETGGGKTKGTDVLLS